MVKVSGQSAVSAYIGGVPAALAPVLRGAAKAAGAVFKEEIAARTTSKEVREGLRLTSKTVEGRVIARVDLEPGWARSIGTWSEYGTSPHFISVDESQREGRSVRRINTLVKDNDGNHSLVIGGAFVGKTVHHPGARPVPVFRPARDTKEKDAKLAAQAYVNRRIRNGKILPGDDE